MLKRIKIGRHLAISRVTIDKLVLAGFCIFVFTGSLYGARAGMRVHQGLEVIGLFLMATAIIGSTWCALYDGSQEEVLIEVGPYSVCRHPIAAFALVGAIGAGAQFGTLTAMLVCFCVAAIVLHFATLNTERTLQAKFGIAYENYYARVPRFLPRFRLWRSARFVKASPRRIARVFLCASLILLASPIAELTEAIHQHERFAAARLAAESHLRTDLPLAH